MLFCTIPTSLLVCRMTQTHAVLPMSEANKNMDKIVTIGIPNSVCQSAGGCGPLCGAAHVGGG